MQEKQKSRLLELFLAGEEKNALLAALRICRGDYPWAFEGWKKESCQIWLDKLEEAIENVLQDSYPWHLMQSEVKSTSKLEFVEVLKPFLVDTLMLYVGGYPTEYGGADIFRAEAFCLIRKLALS